jgi:hypothetical protein
MFLWGGKMRMGSVSRISPKNTSRKAQALEAIKQHFRETGQSPSLSEIGERMEPRVSAQRVQELRDALIKDGKIICRPGTRGIILPEPADMMTREDVLLLLMKHGFKLDLATEFPSFPANDCFPLTYSGLPLLPELDDIPDIGVGESSDDNDGGGSPL